MNDLSELGGRRLIEQIEQRRPVLEVFRDLLPDAFDSTGAPIFSGAVSVALRYSITQNEIGSAFAVPTRARPPSSERQPAKPRLI